MVLSALLKADFTTQWRNRRAVVLVLLVPVLILLSWKGMLDNHAVSGPFVLSTGITIGLIAVGLMGYAISIARDRDKLIFQRLRVAPVPSWCIMLSRLIVQLTMLLLVTIVVFYAGYNLDHIQLSAAGYGLTFVTSIVCGAVYLSLGQVIAGRIKNAETVNSATRLIYIAFVMIGMFGEAGKLPGDLNEMVRWSPYGTVIAVLSGSLQPERWTINTTYALLATIAYTVIFATLGIRWFKWNTK